MARSRGDRSAVADCSVVIFRRRRSALTGHKLFRDVPAQADLRATNCWNLINWITDPRDSQRKMLRCR